MVVISHKHKFIFIKCIRVASSSMEEFFWRFRGENDVFTPFPPKWDKRQNDLGLFNPLKDLLYALKLFRDFPEFGVKERKYRSGWITRMLRHFKSRQRFYDHMPAWMVRNRIGKLYDEYYTFCFERNPWAKVVSRYLFYKKFDPNFNLSFREFVKSIWVYDALNFPLYCDPLKDYRIMVDFIGYYENLEEDFARVMKKIGLPESLDVRINTVSDDNYRRFYDKELKRRVEDAYRFEIELHGYDF